jgi:hypothetical protein
MTFGFAAAAAGCCCHGQAQETAGRLHWLASAIKVETFLLARASITEGHRTGFSSYWLQTFAHSILAHLLFCICVLPGRKRRMAADNDGSVLLTNRHVKPEARRLDWICLFLPSALGCMGHWVPVHFLVQCPHTHIHTQSRTTRNSTLETTSAGATHATHSNTEIYYLSEWPGRLFWPLLQRERESGSPCFSLFLFRLFTLPVDGGQWDKTRTTDRETFFFLKGRRQRERESRWKEEVVVSQKYQKGQYVFGTISK